MSYDNEQILIFSAKLVSSFKADSDRDFLLQYFLEDNTIQIFEGKKAMTGFKGGKFLNRMKVKNPETNQNFSDDSFALGSKLQISGRTFVITDAPEYTLCLMESNPERFPQSDMQFVIESLYQFTEKNSIDLSAKFDEKDIMKANYVTKAEAEDILFSLAPDFPKQSSITIIRRYTTDDHFDYVDLIKCLQFQG